MAGEKWHRPEQTWSERALAVEVLYELRAIHKELKFLNREGHEAEQQKLREQAAKWRADRDQVRDLWAPYPLPGRVREALVGNLVRPDELDTDKARHGRGIGVKTLEVARSAVRGDG